MDAFETNLKLYTNIKKTHIPCKYGNECMGSTEKHFAQYYHPSTHRIKDINKFKECTTEFLLSSRKLYDSNNKNLPDEWYIIIQRYLKESDYTDQDTLYFYIIANIACNFKYFLKRFGKYFMSKVLLGMEAEAVTGMYKVKIGSPVQQCLFDLGIGQEPDGNYYISNTTLEHSILK